MNTWLVALGLRGGCDAKVILLVCENYVLTMTQRIESIGGEKKRKCVCLLVNSVLLPVI